MPGKCFLTHCKNYVNTKKNLENNNLFFYNLEPIIRDEERAKVWASILRINASRFSRSSVICSDHFTEDCFNASDLLKQRLLPHKRFQAPRLLPHATPFLSKKLIKKGITKRMKNQPKGQSKKSQRHTGRGISETLCVSNSKLKDPNNDNETTFEPNHIQGEPVQRVFVLVQSSVLGFEGTRLEELNYNIQVKDEKGDEAQFVMLDDLNDNNNETEEQITPQGTEIVFYDASVSIQNPEFTSTEIVMCEAKECVNVSNQNSEQDVSKHKKTCNILLKCDFCNFQNVHKILLQTHIKHSHLNQCKKNSIGFKNRNYSFAKMKCDICNQKLNIYFCEQKIKPERYTRIVCNFILSKSYNIMCKKETSQFSYPCTQCFESFISKNDFKDHLFDHYSGNI